MLIRMSEVRLPTKSLRLLSLAVIAALGANHGQADETLRESNIADGLDWVPISVLPDEQKDLQCRQCGGRYIDPLADVDKSVPPEDSDLEVKAGDTEVTESTLIFENSVTVTQGYRELRADRVTVDRASKVAEAEGNITLREPGVILVGQNATYDSNTEVATLADSRFVLHEEGLHGSAGRLVRHASGVISIEEGSISYCAPGDPVWELKTKSLELDPEDGVGTAHGAKLEVAGVPIFYTPWIQFPIDDRRKTGLLFPDIGSDTRGGVDITQPIYLNLAPNYDMTYSPRYIQERGVVHEVNARYLGKTIDFWDIDGAYLGTDDKYKGEVPSSDGKRWLFGVKHQGRHGANFRTSVDYAKVSDPDYIKDLENNSLSAQRQTNLLQQGRVDYLDEQWAIGLEAQQFQSLADDIRNDYKKLPQLTATWRGDQDWAGFKPIGTVQYSYFDHADDNRVTGQRVYSEFGATYPMQAMYGFLKPTVKYRQINYSLQDSVFEDDSPSAGSFVGSLDAGLTFERTTSFWGEKGTQTLEPRAFYLYSEYTDQIAQPDFDSAELTFSYSQLYRDTRFSGHDRLDDANQVAFGVTTRFFAESDGRERLNASIGQIYYFRDREVRLRTIDQPLVEDTSPIAAELNWLPTKQWKLRSSLLYDTRDSSFDAASAQLTYSGEDGRIFNLGYTLREPPPTLANRPVTEQANVSAYMPIDDNWSVFGALEYSLEGSASVEDMVGFEYDDCCWRVRVLYMRYIDTAPNEIPNFSDPNLERQRALQFQIVLKGMGGFGGRVDNLLKDMIRGFNDRY